MRKLKRKLRSRQGASITFALLIFLVCAIVSGVVVVAASTAGGRMSGLRETDQRYFAATIAAHTLMDKFDGKTVVFTYNKSGDAYTMVSAKDASGNNVADAILKDASWAAVTGTAYSHAAWTATNTASSGAAYTCTITPQPSNGALTFAITASGGTAINSGTYALDILFTPNVKRPDTGANQTGARATVTWSLNSLSKGRATQTTPAGG